MKKSVTSDWKLIEGCFLTGASLRELSERFSLKQGTIKQHLRRKGCYDLKRQLVSENPSQVPEPKGDLAARSQRVRQILAADVEASAIVLAEMKQSKKPLPFKLRQAAVNQLATTASTVFSWKDTQQSTLVNIAVLSQCTSSLPEQPVTDVPRSVEPDAP